MSNPPNPSASSSSSSQFTYANNNNNSYFPMPFHLQQPQSYPPPPPAPVYPAPPSSSSLPGVYFPQFQQAQQLFQRDAQTITPEALESIHKRAASLQSKPLPYSDLCEIVFQSIFANGDGQWTNTEIRASASAFEASASGPLTSGESTSGASAIRERIRALNMDDDPLVDVAIDVDDDDDDGNSRAHKINDEVRPKKKAKTSRVTM
ncbi:hypothetical protein Tco_1518981, partial [Tanacetum coccineum]